MQQEERKRDSFFFACFPETVLIDFRLVTSSDGENSSIGRAPDCGSGCYGIVPRFSPHFSSRSFFLRNGFFSFAG